MSPHTPKELLHLSSPHSNLLEGSLIGGNWLKPLIWCYFSWAVMSQKGNSFLFNLVHEPHMEMQRAYAWIP